MTAEEWPETCKGAGSDDDGKGPQAKERLPARASRKEFSPDNNLLGLLPPEP